MTTEGDSSTERASSSISVTDTVTVNYSVIIRLIHLVPYAYHIHRTVAAQFLRKLVVVDFLRAWV